MVDGQGTGLLYTISSNSAAAVTWPSTFVPYTCVYVAGFFVVEQPGTNVFWVSNFNDGSTWGSTAFAYAVSDSDQIVAVDQLFGNLLIFMNIGMEFWQDQGLLPQPFAPILSAANNYGLAAIWSRAHVDQGIIFLARNPEGGLQFVQLVNVYSPQVVSDADIDDLVNSFSVTSDAVALVYQVGQHKFYQCTFVSENRTLLLDCSTRQWSEVQAGTSVVPVRHQANFSVTTNSAFSVTTEPEFDDSITAGQFVTHGGAVSTGYSNGLDPNNTGLVFGSISNSVDQNGNTISGIYTNSSFSVHQSSLTMPFASDPGISYFYALTVAGSVYPSMLANYSYTSGYAIWIWPQSVSPLFPLISGGKYAIKIVYMAPTISVSGYQTYFSDYQNGNVYTMNEDSYTDNGVPIVREIITRHVLSNFNRVRPSLIYFDMETGVGLQSGQGQNPTVMIQYSKDDGRTWSGERYIPLGAVGMYQTRVVARRFGSTRTATWRIRMTDPVKFVITEGAIKIAERQPAEKLG